MVPFPGFPMCFKRVVAGHENDPKNTNIQLNSMMQGIVTVLARKRPMWRFVATDTGAYPTGAGAGCTHKCFSVYQHDEELGRISITWASRGDCYSISNGRIRSKFKRGVNGISTIDLARAAKVVLSFFVAKSMRERISELEGSVSALVGNTTNNAVYRKNRAYSDMYRVFTEYMINHPDAFNSLPVVTNSEIIAHKAFVANVQLAVSMEALLAQFSSQDGVFVLLDNGSYAVSPAGTDNTPTYVPADEVPDGIRQKVGILKLVEDNSVVEGVGARITASAFWVAGESYG
jgi:hypothetical protein